MGNDNLAEILRMEMMVYQYFSCRGCKNSVTHGIYTMDSIKVQTTNDIRLGNQLVGKLLVAVVQKDVLAPGHPFQEVGSDLNLVDWLSQFGEGNEVYMKGFLGAVYRFICAADA